MAILSCESETAQHDLRPESEASPHEVPLGREVELLKEYPVANTFIQFQAPRDASLEKFLPKREAQSCPASRNISMDGLFDTAKTLGSVDEEECVTHWPVTRGPSLEEETDKKPGLSRMVSEDEEPPQWPATRGPSLEEEAQGHSKGKLIMVPMEQDPIQFSLAPWGEAVAPMQCVAMPGASLDVDAWDPSQWSMDPTSSAVIHKEQNVFMNDSPGGMAVYDPCVETEFVVEPVSRLTPWPVNFEPFLQPAVTASPEGPANFIFPTEHMAAAVSQHMSARGNRQSWSTPQAGQFASCPTSQNLAKWDAMNEVSTDGDPLLEKFMMTKTASACDASDSTAASSVDGDAVRELLIPKGMFDDMSHNSELDSSPSRTQPGMFDDPVISALCTSTQPGIFDDQALRMQPGMFDDQALQMQPGMLDDQACLTSVPDNYGDQSENAFQDPSGTLAINLTYSLGMWSIGSAKHATGNCKPCGFLWKKGCQKAQNCEFCHLCKSDEVKKRKRDKIATRIREEQEQMMWECGADEQAMPNPSPRVLPPLR